MSKFVDLTGMKFGYLTVLQRVKKPKYDGNYSPKAYWICLCDCGNYTLVEGNNLKKGYVKSCGCLDATTHGGSNTKLYYTWYNMKTRCNNPHSRMFAAYGGRGIKVCDEWVHNFARFREWSLSNGYRDGLTIDRIDNDKGYSPDNCRWVSREFNTKHQRNNIKIEYNGRVFESLTDFSKRIGVSQPCLSRSIHNGTFESKYGATVLNRITQEE